MKFNRTILVVAISSAMVLSLSACSHSGGEGHSGSPAPAATAPAAAPAATVPTPASTAASGSTSAAAPASASSVATMVANNQKAGDNWFGGPIYNGQPDLDATAALVKAGGGADDFSFQKALVSMLGEKTVNAEVDKLGKQYGKQDADGFVSGMTFVVQDALKRATAAGVKLPTPPASLHGKALAERLVKDGTAPDGTFWSGYLFDHTVTHNIHNEVMADIDAQKGQAADANTHKILNQAMFDVAQATGHKDVKLASFH